MKKLFKIQQNHEWMEIRNVSPYSCYHYSFDVDGQITGIFYSGNIFLLHKNWFAPGKHILTIRAYAMMETGPVPIFEKFTFEVPSRDIKRELNLRDRDFRAGDILIASDNVGYIPKGYMGHSALVISENHLIESPGGHPAIRKDSIAQFIRLHPLHAQYRPKSAEMGEKAAQYARKYLEQYKQNLTKGEQKPIFSFSLGSSLEDPWTHIYCSKLIWLCYANGCDYKFKNDFLWFSPEDLEKNLSKSPDFERIYKHPKYGFKLNT